MPLLPYPSNIITVKQTHKCWYDSSTRLDAGRLHVHFCLKVLQVYWLRLDSKSWSYLVLLLPWSKIIVWIQPRTGPQFSGKRPQRRKSGWLFGPPHPKLIVCVLELEKQKVENTDRNELKELEKVAGKWHGIRVRSLGLGWQGRCIERASTGPSTCNVLWCHSLNDFRISVCDNK